MKERIPFKILALFAVMLVLTVEAAQSAANTPSKIRGLNYIGSKKQFFFDEKILETLENTKPRLNQAVKVASNPIIRRDKPWEGPDIRLMNVFYDELLGKFRLIYSTGVYFADGRDENGNIRTGVRREGHSAEYRTHKYRQPTDHPAATRARLHCEAFSDDGVNWEKPELGMVEFNGSTANNILPLGSYFSYSFLDMHENDPSRRYKALVRTTPSEHHLYGQKGKGLTWDLYYSSDYYHWTPYEGNPVIDYTSRGGRFVEDGGPAGARPDS